MKSVRLLVAAGALLSLVTWGESTALAFGRKFSGGHPYHNGYHFVAPSSAYEGVWYRPPFRYGSPAYHFPHSYLVPGKTYYPSTAYGHIPSKRAASYYMSAHGYYYSMPW